MASIKPFAALRPKPELAPQICELPYDVMSSDEAREMAGGNPLSFLRVSKPEIDLPRGTDIYSAEIYARGAENFRKLISQGALAQDARPNFYLYRQVMGGHSQTGIVGAASCEEYLAGVIKKHELTRVDKEDDRVRHIEALNSQTGPVFLIYKSVGALEEFIAKKTGTPAEIDFTAKDGVRHLTWKISAPDEIQFVEKQFAQIPFLYIADGHHRSAAAGRVFKARQGRGESGRFLAVIFPHNQMRILPYNRVLKDLNGHSPEQLQEKLKAIFTVADGGGAAPEAKHKMGFYFRGKWKSLTFREKFLRTTDPLQNLDVELLQQHVLGPIFGIHNPRTSRRIHFVGGIRGAGELERLVDSGEFACAFSMFPTSVEDLITVADADEIMPPKSTWFEPKLRDGMFCHLI